MEDVIVTLLDGTQMSKNEVPVGTIYINENGVKVKKIAPKEDSGKTIQQIGSDFFDFASKTAKKVSSSVVEWNNERIERQQEEEKRIREEQSGYYFRDGMLHVTTLEGMKTWMRELTKDSTPAILQTLQTQLVVLNTIQSPAMIGMALDNMIVCLDKALKCCSSDEEKGNVRESFAAMIQNYMFFMEARIRCAQMNSSADASMLLVQAGGLLSDAITRIAMIASTKPFDMSKVFVKNIFEQEEYQTSYIKSVFGWLGDAIHLKEKEEEYYSVVETLFETIGQYSNLFGKSILINGMLKRYRKQLVSRRKASLMDKYVDRNSHIDTDKIGSLVAGISSAAISWFSPDPKNQIGGTISGAATAVGAAAGLVIDAVNDGKKALDLDAFCKLEDSIENEIEQLQNAYKAEQDALKQLEAEYETLGFLQLTEKKKLQQQIDDKKSQVAALNDVIIQTKQKFTELKSLFPDSHVINEELNKYEKSLIAIESKFAVYIVKSGIMALGDFIKNVAKETAEKASKVAEQASASAKEAMSKGSFRLEDVTSNWNKFAEYYTGKNVDEILKDKAEKGGTELTYLTLILDEVGKLPDVTTTQKISIRGAIGYLASPIDYISDIIPGVGYSDDILVLSSGVSGVSDIVTDKIKKAAVSRLKKFIPEYDVRDVQKVDASIQVWTINLQKSRERVEAIKQTVNEQVQAIDQTIEDVKNSEEYKQVVAYGEQVGAATVKGAKVVTGVQGYQDRQEAMDINAQAEQIKKYVKEHTEELRVSLNDGLEELGKIRLTALHNVVGRFIDCLKRMDQGAKAKEYEFLSEIDLDPGHIQEMESLDMEAGDALKVLAVGGGFAAVGIAATPAIVTGVVTSLCAASTGTAISTLSGAAAHGAVLAWLGGGTIAAGGGGMAAGTVVLGALTGGVAIGAAVVAMGSLASAFYSRKLTEATKYLAAVQEWEAQTKQSWVALEAMKKRIEEIKTVTLQLESRASDQLDKLEHLIPTFNNDDIEHVEVFRQSAILAKSMSELAQVSLLDENGNLTSESSIVAAKTEKLLNTNL